MRFFNRPASGKASGNTFSASHEPPGRTGASHSSHAKPSTISDKRLPTANARVQVTTGGRAGGSAAGGAEGKGAVFIAGYDASNESPRLIQAQLEGAVGALSRHAANLALARYLAHAAPALSRRPSRPDGQQPHFHHADLAGAAGHGDVGVVHGVSDVRQVPGFVAEIFPAVPGARQH